MPASGRRSRACRRARGDACRVRQRRRPPVSSIELTIEQLGSGAGTGSSIPDAGVRPGSDASGSGSDGGAAPGSDAGSGSDGGTSPGSDAGAGSGSDAGSGEKCGCPKLAGEGYNVITDDNCPTAGDGNCSVTTCKHTKCTTNGTGPYCGCETISTITHVKSFSNPTGLTEYGCKNGCAPSAIYEKCTPYYQDTTSSTEKTCEYQDAEGNPI